MRKKPRVSLRKKKEEEEARKRGRKAISSHS
jgi:hypothetical protein